LSKDGCQSPSARKNKKFSCEKYFPELFFFFKFFLFFRKFFFLSLKNFTAKRYLDSDSRRMGNSYYQGFSYGVSLLVRILFSKIFSFFSFIGLSEILSQKVLVRSSCEFKLYTSVCYPWGSFRLRKITVSLVSFHTLKIKKNWLKISFFFETSQKPKDQISRSPFKNPAVNLFSPLNCGNFERKFSEEIFFVLSREIS